MNLLKLLLIAIFFCLPILVNAVTLTQGATVTSGSANLSSASSWTFSHTCNTGTGSNAYMILVIALNSSTISVSTVTYDGASMTQVVQDKTTNAYSNYWSVWKLANPILNSSKTVQVNLSGSATFLAAYAAYSFTDCGGVGNYNTSTNSTTPSTTLSVSSNSMILGAAIGGNSSAATMSLPSGSGVTLSPSSINYSNFAWGGVSARLTSGSKTIEGSSPSAGHNLRGIEIKEAVVLPVELLSFKAILNDKNIEIQWKTASEQNSDYFILEKSYNGKDWNKINEVKSVGNSTSISTYTWNDDSDFDGVGYYKLTQVDVDGRKETFDIISLNSSEYKIINNFKLYPNPTSGKVTIELNSNNDDEINIQVENFLGQILFNKMHKISTGFNSISLDLESFGQGIYFLKIDNYYGFKLNKKVLKE